jgi:hypothetical protein
MNHDGQPSQNGMYVGTAYLLPRLPVAEGLIIFGLAKKNQNSVRLEKLYDLNFS